MSAASFIITVSATVQGLSGYYCRSEQPPRGNSDAVQKGFGKAVATNWLGRPCLAGAHSRATSCGVESPAVATAVAG